MNLDHETLAELGYGDPWEQLALRWPLYVVASTRRDWRKCRTTTRRAPASPLTIAQRREAARWSVRGHSPAIIASRIGATHQAVRAYLAAKATA